MKSQSFRAGARKNSSSQGNSPLLTIGNAAIFPRHLFGTVALVACGVLVAVAKSNGAQSAPTTPAPAPGAKANVNRTVRGAQVPVTADNAPTVESAGVAPVIGDDGRRPIEFYTQTVRGGLFNAPEPPQPKAPVAEVIKTQPTKVPVNTTVVTPNPFENWIYTGTINSNGQVTALIENLETKEGRFIKLGDEMLGARATSVDENLVTFKVGKEKYELGKSANMSMTPLDRTAIPTTAQQAQQPQAPGQPAQPMVITPNAPAATGFTLPNGMQLTPDQMQRRMQRMNRNFNQ